MTPLSTTWVHKLMTLYDLNDILYDLNDRLYDLNDILYDLKGVDYLHLQK